jgi:general secretion pathway protein A
VTLRVLAERLSAQRDVQVGVLSRPQAYLADFYRELGDLFGVPLHPHNRWMGAKLLRERWQAHIDASLCRPVLIVELGVEVGQIGLRPTEHADLDVALRRQTLGEHT